MIASAIKFSNWGEIQSKPDPDPINTCSKSYERKSNSILNPRNRLEMNMKKKVDFRGGGTPFLGPPFLLRARVRARHGQKILGEPPNLGTFAPKSPISARLGCVLQHLGADVHLEAFAVALKCSVNDMARALLARLGVNCSAL